MIFPWLRLLWGRWEGSPYTWQPCMPYSWMKLLSWAQAARWRVLWHRRSEGISSIQLFESSRYWGLQGPRGRQQGSGGGSGGRARGTWLLRGQGISSLVRCEESKRPRGPENSLSLEVLGGPIQTHDQIFFPRFQVKAARGSNQEVSGLTSSGLGILG